MFQFSPSTGPRRFPGSISLQAPEATQPPQSLDSVRRHRLRPAVAVVALTSFLLTQWLMPCAFTLQSAAAAERARQPRQVKPEWVKKRDVKETVQRRLQEKRLAQRPQPQSKASKPGQVKPSEADGCEDCEVSMSALDLRRVPTEKELRMAGQLGGALSPIGNGDPAELAAELDKELKAMGFPDGLASQLPPTTPAGMLLKQKKDKLKALQLANLSFGQAIQEWNKHNYRQAGEMFKQHVEEFPESPWAGEAVLHLGCDAKYNGRFTEAQQTYEQLLQSTSGDKTDPSYEIHQKAKLRWADLDMALGRWASAETKLADILKTDTDWRRITWARHWFRNAQQFKHARNLQACGSQALSVVLASLNKKDAAAKVALLQPTHAEGFSIAEIASIAGKNGLPMRGFKANAPQQLAAMPMPLIVHYDFGAQKKSVSTTPSLPAKADKTLLERGQRVAEKSIYRAPARAGHFLVVQKVNTSKKIVQIFDPLELRLYHLSFGEFSREWSGKGLMLERGVKNAQVGFGLNRIALLSSEETQNTRGGCCGVPSPENDDCVNYTGGGGGCGGGLGGGGLGGGGKGGANSPSAAYGSPVWSVNKLNLNLRVTDTPLWYSTPKGPDVEVTMTYNSNDATTQNNPFGNKWMFNYGSYVLSDPGNQVILVMPNGTKAIYNADGNGGYTPEKPDNHNILRKTTSTHYEVEFQGGDKAIYDIPAGTSSLQPFLIELRDRWGYSLTFGYDANVRLTSITDAAGKVTNLIYDTQGHIEQIWDPMGRHVTFAYDSAGNMKEAIDMEGHAFQYTYDATKRITQLNTAQGPWDFYHEGPDGNNACNDCYPTPGGPTWASMRLTITDPAGKKEEYFYNGGYTNGTSSQIQDPQLVGGVRRGLSWHVSKNAYTNYTPELNNSSPSVPRTRWIAFLYDEWNPVFDRVLRMLYPNGDNEYYTYDSQGLPATIINSRAKTTTIDYNGAGQITSITDPKSQTTILDYAPNGIDVTSITNAENVTTATYAYNTKHQPLSIADGSNATTMTYTAWGAPDTVTRDGQTTIFSYATSGHLTSITRGGATLASYTYDAMNRVETQTNASGLTIGYEYNNNDKVTRVVYPDGTDVRNEYVCCGLPGAVKDRAGRWTYYDYDVMKRLIRVQDASGQQVFFGYDANGNRTKMVDARGNTTNWQYDSRDRVIRKTYAGDKVEEYSYSPTGKVSARRNGKNEDTIYSYDDNDNLIGIDYPNMTDVTFSYNALDRPVTMTDGLGTSTFGYDVIGRLTSANGPWADDTVTYDYTAAGQREWMKINGTSTTSYAYDALERLKTLSSPAGTFTYSYDSAISVPYLLQLGNATVVEKWHDEIDNAEMISNGRSDGTNISHYYNWMDSGDKVYASSVQIGSQPEQRVLFAYDTSRQLTREVLTDATSQVDKSYAYDPMGNRTVKRESQNDTTTQTGYSTNSLSQTTGVMTSSNSGDIVSTLTYDDNGNMVETSAANHGNTTYGYDDADRLTSITVRDVSNAPVRKSEFIYDGFSRKRISREYVWNAAANNNIGAWAGQSEVRRIYDGMNVIQERNDSDAVTAFYTRGIDMGGGIGGLLAKSTVEFGHTYYHYDGRGNVAQLTNESGLTVAQYSYDAFGNTITSSGVEANHNTYRFSTKEIHANSGLYDYGYRFYSPGLGKWINRDPVQESGGINLYGYVKNNPVNRIDPYGLRGRGCITHGMPACVEYDEDGDDSWTTADDDSEDQLFVPPPVFFPQPVPAPKPPPAPKPLPVTVPVTGGSPIGAFDSDNQDDNSGFMPCKASPCQDPPPRKPEKEKEIRKVPWPTQQCGPMPGVPPRYQKGGAPEFGGPNGIDWGSHKSPESAQERASQLTHQMLLDMGLTCELAKEWRDFYECQAALGPEPNRKPSQKPWTPNYTAARRAIIMQRAVELLCGDG